jgi:hypothetical protein
MILKMFCSRYRLVRKAPCIWWVWWAQHLIVRHIYSNLVDPACRSHVALYGSVLSYFSLNSQFYGIQAIFGGRLSETWYQADSTCSYMYGIIQEKLPYSRS